MKDRNRKGQFVKGRSHTAWNKGKKFPQEYRDRLSAAHKGKKLSRSHRKAISEGHKGRKSRHKWYGPPFKVAREICWEKSRGRCRRCHKRIALKKRHTHHVNWNTRDNRQRNLIPLCGGCHGYYHRILAQIKNLEKNIKSYPNRMQKQFWKRVKTFWKHSVSYM